MRSFAIILLATWPAVAGAQQDTQQKPSVDDQIKDEQLRQLRIANDAAERAGRIGRTKELVDALPASPSTGATTMKEGAGQAEAYALATTAVRPLAAEIAGRVVKALNATRPVASDTLPADWCKPIPSLADPAAGAAGALAPVLLTSGQEVATFAHWQQFRFRACKLAKDYADATGKLTKATRAQTTAVLRPGGSAAAIGAALSGAVKLAQLAIPDWEITPAKADVSNRVLLLEVADALRIESSDRAVYWQGVTGSAGGATPVFEALRTLSTLDDSASGAAAEAKSRIDQDEAALKKAGSPEAAAKDKLEPLLATTKAASAELQAVEAAHVQLLKDMYGGETASPLPFGAVVNEASAARVLGTSGLVVNVSVDSSGGNVVSRKAIWNVFEAGSPPVFVSGTATVSFAVVRPADQLLVRSGSMSCTTGPVRLSRVQQRLRPSPKLECQ